MGRFFAENGRPMQILSKLCDIVILSFVFLISCIPVITIGAAFTSLYYVSVKVIREGRGYLFREYISCFKSNFVQSTVAWLVTAVLLMIAGFNAFYSIFYARGVVGVILLSVYFAIFFLVLGFSAYIFPILSRFVLSQKDLFKMSLGLMLKHYKYSVPIVIIYLLFLVGMYFGIVGMPLLLFFLPAGVSLCSSFFLEKVFAQYIPEATGDAEKDKVDSNWES